MTFDRDKTIVLATRASLGAWPHLPISIPEHEKLAAAALPVIVDAVLAEIEQIHRPWLGTVSALYPNPVCACGVSWSPCPTAQACAAIREAVQA